MRKVGQEISDEVINGAVNVIMDSIVKTKQNVEEVYQEVKEIIDEQVKGAVQVAIDSVMEAGNEENSEVKKESEVRRMKNGMDAIDKWLYSSGLSFKEIAELKEFWESILKMGVSGVNGQAIRDYGYKKLDEYRDWYKMGDEEYLICKAAIDGAAEYVDEYDKLAEQAEKELRKKYPWLYD
jgi:DNA-directed RNA polymerase beta' subunit